MNILKMENIYPVIHTESKWFAQFYRVKHRKAYIKNYEAMLIYYACYLFCK